MSGEEQSNETRALTPTADDGREGPSPALLALYHELPGDVVAIIEYERKAITRDVLDHLRHIRGTLAPSGRFREWCLAVGLNYGPVSNRLSRADKPAVNGQLTDLLLAAGHELVAKDSIAWEVLACGVTLRPWRDQWEPSAFEDLCWMLAWWSLLHEELPTNNMLVARLAGVLAWSVGEAEA